MIHKCLIISTGGTIEGRIATDKLDTNEFKQSDAFTTILEPSISLLDNYHGIKVEVEHQAVCNVDSSDILPSNWSDLAALIKEKYDDYDSFIIVHGTNTMGYTAAALSFALPNLNKPVIFTGSQVPAGMAGSDAEMNLNNSLRVAVWQDNMKNIKGVVAVFGSYIITGARVKKSTEFDYDAFISYRANAIGRIGRIINIDEANLDRHLNYLTTNKYTYARRAEKLICENDFNMNILSLTESPGMNTDIFKSLVERNNTQGFIIRAFGAGDVSHIHHDTFRYLKNLQIPIVVTTQIPNGNSNFQVNELGQHLREENLAIPAYDMSIESMTVKLAWLLAKKNKNLLSYDSLCDEMTKNIHGEINVLWETGI